MAQKLKPAKLDAKLHAALKYDLEQNQNPENSLQLRLEGVYKQAVTLWIMEERRFDPDFITQTDKMANELFDKIPEEFLRENKYDDLLPNKE